MNFSPERMEASVQAMKENYPSFLLDGHPTRIREAAVWTGWIQPIRQLEDLKYLLADLAQDRVVRVLPGGEVIHHPKCQRKHQELPQLGKLKKPDKAFKVKIVYGGGSRHPRGYVIDPIIPADERPHMFGDGAVCAYAPWKGIWEWQLNTVADFTDQMTIWLIKWNVWQQTGLWIGSEMEHDKVFLYFNIDADAQCWCGSGEIYRNCHRETNKIEAKNELGFI